MKKTKEQMEAELIVADLLKYDTAEKCLQKVKILRQKREFAIAQRVTLTIMLCTVWDFYEDFNEEMLKDLYAQYLEYHKSFDAGKEKIFKQMNEIDKMLDGELLKEKMFEVVKEKAKEGKE